MGATPSTGVTSGAPYAGANFQWLAANTVNDATGKTPLPPYWIKKIESVKIGFIGMTLEDTDTLVAQAGIEGWSFLDEAETANALVPELQRQGVEAIVVLLHEGGTQTPAPGAINACEGISGPIVGINALLDPAIDVVITGHTHLPYNCKLNGESSRARSRSAGSSPRWTSSWTRARTTCAGTSAPRSTMPSSGRSSRPDPAITAVINKWKPLGDEIGNQEVGSITADIKRAFTAGGAEDGAPSRTSAT